MALHHRQRQSCKRRTLPQVLSHTVHLALTGRFPSNHWCGIEICKRYRGREATWTFQSATQGRRRHCGTEMCRETRLSAHCLRAAEVISRKHLRTTLGILHHAQAHRPRDLLQAPQDTDLHQTSHMISYCSYHSIIFLLPKFSPGSPCLQLFNLNPQCTAGFSSC